MDDLRAQFPQRVPNYQQDRFTRASGAFVDAYVAKKKRLAKLKAKQPQSTFIPVLEQEMKAEQAFYDAAEAKIKDLEREILIKNITLQHNEVRAIAFAKSKGLLLEWMCFAFKYSLKYFSERRKDAA